MKRAILRTHAIGIGKLLPPMLIGIFHMTVYISAAVFLFEVPLRGSLLMLYASSLFYLGSIAGIGLFISAMSITQQQAILGGLLFLVPATFLLGFAIPIENMLDWLQPVTVINALIYFLVIVKGIFLKYIGPDDLVDRPLFCCW